VSATTFVVSGTSLVETVQQSGATLATRTLTAYSVTSSKGDALLTTSANFSLSGNSKRLGQFAYTVKSLQPFISTNYDMPTSGALIVNGAGSSVTMTVTPDGVRMDYSDNANGTIVNSATLARRHGVRGPLRAGSRPRARPGTAWIAIRDNVRTFTPLACSKLRPRSGIQQQRRVFDASDPPTPPTMSISGHRYPSIIDLPLRENT
jgi:hypothetical protein